MDTLADIAARYGARVLPGVTVRRVPMGQSGIPLPVWDGDKNQLVVPGWKEHEEGRRRAAVKNAARARRRGMAQDAALMERLKAMHGQGMRPPAIAAATGLKPDQVYRLLASVGLRFERVAPVDRGPSPATLERAGDVRRLAAEGLTRDEIARRLGYSDVKHLVQFARRRLPDLVLPTVSRKGKRATGGSARNWDRFRAEQQARVRALLAEVADEAAIGLALDIRNPRHLRRVIRAAAPGHQFPARMPLPRLAERDEKILRLIATMSVRGIAELTGLSEGAVSASVRRSRRAGLIAPEVEAARQKRGRRMLGGALAVRDREVAGLVREMSYRDVGARLGLTLPQVKASVHRLRAGGVLPPAWAERMPMREASMNGAKPRLTERAARILALHGEGWTVDRIAPEVSAPRASVVQTLRRAGAEPRFARALPKAERLAELPGLVAQGLTGAEIAARWGKGLRYVYGLASKAGIGLAGNARAHNAGDVSARVAARRELVRHLYTSGHSHAQMRELLKISPATLSGDIKALGISGTSAYARSRRKAVPGAAEAERRAV